MDCSWQPDGSTNTLDWDPAQREQPETLLEYPQDAIIGTCKDESAAEKSAEDREDEESCDSSSYGEEDDSCSHQSWDSRSAIDSDADDKGTLALNDFRLVTWFWSLADFVLRYLFCCKKTKPGWDEEEGVSDTEEDQEQRETAGGGLFYQTDGVKQASTKEGGTSTLKAATVAGVMAPLAARNAGVASAAATQSSVAAAAGVSTGAASSLATSVASAGVVTQTTTALATAAVAAAAVTSVTVAPQPSANTTLTEMLLNGTNLTRDFIPPVCPVEADLKQGYVELQIEGLSEEELTANQGALEDLFRDTYNNMTGMCLDKYGRVMHEAKLQNWTTTDNVLRESSGGPEGSMPYSAPVTTTYWVGAVDCNGCPDHEPLFEDPLISQQRRMQLTQWHLNTTFDASDFFPLFTASFSYTIAPILRNDNNNSTVITSAATMVSSSSFNNNTVVTQIGEATIARYWEIVEDNGGPFQMPFIIQGLAALFQCSQEADQPNQRNVCDQLLGDSPAELASCMEHPLDYSCQEILAEAIDRIPGLDGNAAYFGPPQESNKPEKTDPVIEPSSNNADSNTDDSKAILDSFQPTVVSSSPIAAPTTAAPTGPGITSSSLPMTQQLAGSIPSTSPSPTPTSEPVVQPESPTASPIERDVFTAHTEAPNYSTATLPTSSPAQSKTIHPTMEGTAETTVDITVETTEAPASNQPTSTACSDPFMATETLYFFFFSGSTEDLTDERVCDAVLEADSQMSKDTCSPIITSVDTYARSKQRQSQSLTRVNVLVSSSQVSGKPIFGRADRVNSFIQLYNSAIQESKATLIRVSDSTDAPSTAIPGTGLTSTVGPTANVESPSTSPASSAPGSAGSNFTPSTIPTAGTNEATPVASENLLGTSPTSTPGPTSANKISASPTSCPQNTIQQSEPPHTASPLSGMPTKTETGVPPQSPLACPTTHPFSSLVATTDSPTLSPRSPTTSPTHDGRSIGSATSGTPNPAVAPAKSPSPSPTTSAPYNVAQSTTVPPESSNAGPTLAGPSGGSASFISPTMAELQTTTKAGSPNARPITANPSGLGIPNTSQAGPPGSPSNVPTTAGPSTQGPSSGYPTTAAPTAPTAMVKQQQAQITTSRSTNAPTLCPSNSPTSKPTYRPTNAPTPGPSPAPTPRPTRRPTNAPTPRPSLVPTQRPTLCPTNAPTPRPSPAPTQRPTATPSNTTPPFSLAPALAGGEPSGKPNTSAPTTFALTTNCPTVCPSTSAPGAGPNTESPASVRPMAAAPSAIGTSPSASPTTVATNNIAPAILRPTDSPSASPTVAVPSTEGPIMVAPTPASEEPSTSPTTSTTTGLAPATNAPSMCPSSRPPVAGPSTESPASASPTTAAPTAAAASPSARPTTSAATTLAPTETGPTMCPSTSPSVAATISVSPTTSVPTVTDERTSTGPTTSQPLSLSPSNSLPTGFPSAGSTITVPSTGSPSGSQATAAPTVTAGVPTTSAPLSLVPSKLDPTLFPSLCPSITVSSPSSSVSGGPPIAAPTATAGSPSSSPTSCPSLFPSNDPTPSVPSTWSPSSVSPTATTPMPATGAPSSSSTISPPVSLAPSATSPTFCPSSSPTMAGPSSGSTASSSPITFTPTALAPTGSPSGTSSTLAPSTSAPATTAPSVFPSTIPTEAVPSLGSPSSASQTTAAPTAAAESSTSLSPAPTVPPSACLSTSPTMVEPSTLGPFSGSPTTASPSTSSTSPINDSPFVPTVSSTVPSRNPTSTSSISPSDVPSVNSVFVPSAVSICPSSSPSSFPSVVASTSSMSPSQIPSSLPSIGPSHLPSEVPSRRPSESPSEALSNAPSTLPSTCPSSTPSFGPSGLPSLSPSSTPSSTPSSPPSMVPSTSPSKTDCFDILFDGNIIKSPIQCGNSAQSCQSSFGWDTSGALSLNVDAPAAGNPAHVELPSIQGWTDLTVEIRLKRNAARYGQRAFDFGKSVSGNGDSYFMMALQWGEDTGTQVVGLKTSGNAVEELSFNANLLDGAFHDFAIVYSSSPREMRAYMDGAFLGAVAVAQRLEDISSVNNYLGKSQWASDSYSVVSYRYVKISPEAKEFAPSAAPSQTPSSLPSVGPSHVPSMSPSVPPSEAPTLAPSSEPSSGPTECSTNLADLVADGMFCYNNLFLGPSNDGFGFDLQGCAEATRSTPECHGEYFYFSASYNGQCACAKDSCQSRGQSAAHRIYRIGKCASHMPSDVPSMNPSVSPTVVASREPSSEPTECSTNLANLVANGMFCSNNNFLGPNNDGFGFNLQGCAEATRSTPDCHGEYFYFSASYNGQCACAKDSCQSRGQSDAHNIYRIGNCASHMPSDVPSMSPSLSPSKLPSSIPSMTPSKDPTSAPSVAPSVAPSDLPSTIPSVAPSDLPSTIPSFAPSDLPSTIPSVGPSDLPSTIPSSLPSMVPSASPTLGGFEAVFNGNNVGCPIRCWDATRSCETSFDLDSNGDLTLNADTSAGNAAYVELPSIQGWTELTVEMRLKVNGAITSQRAFDFGSSVAGEGESYMTMMLQFYDDTSTQTIGIKVGNVIQHFQVQTNLDDGLWHDFGVVYSTSPRKMEAFFDGTLVGSLSVTHRLEDITSVDNYLGRSQWASESWAEVSYSFVKITPAALPL